MHKETFEVTDEYEEERLDKFLAAIYPEQSRSFFQKLIKDGLVLVNDVPQSKANYRMHIEDMVSVTIREDNKDDSRRGLQRNACKCNHVPLQGKSFRNQW